jgi:hypothetical protein
MLFSGRTFSGHSRLVGIHNAVSAEAVSSTWFTEFIRATRPDKHSWRHYIVYSTLLIFVARSWVTTPRTCLGCSLRRTMSTYTWRRPSREKITRLHSFSERGMQPTQPNYRSVNSLSNCFAIDYSTPVNVWSTGFVGVT